MIRARVFPPTGRSYTIELPFDAAIIARAIDRHLVIPNVQWLRGRRLPSFWELAQAGDIEYGSDDSEEWYSYPVALENRIIDCEEAGSMAVADDRTRGIDSEVGAYLSEKHGIHIIDRRPLTAPVDALAKNCTRGFGPRVRIVDPSLAIGMKKFFRGKMLRKPLIERE